MKKLIEMQQHYLVECDNEKCDFKLENDTKDANSDIAMFIDVACPKCGENLLTKEDYLLSLKVMKIINRMNKWFSWITLFIPKSKETKHSMKIHKGIKIDK